MEHTKPVILLEAISVTGTDNPGDTAAVVDNGRSSYLTTLCQPQRLWI
jgi:hypothetical protein